MDIKGKTAIITGAASGIGLAAAREMVKHGINIVALVDRSPLVEQYAVEINRDAGRRVAISFQGDTTKEDFRQQVFAQLRKETEVVNILVPAAGITRDAIAVKLNKEKGVAQIYPADTFREVVEVNLVAPIYWALELVAQMAEHRFRNGLKKWNPAQGSPHFSP